MGVRVSPAVVQAGVPNAAAPDVLGQDVDHPHGPELGHEVLVDRVGVGLLCADLDLVVGKPRLLDVLLEGLPSPPWVTDPTLAYLGFGVLPGLLGLLLR